MTAQKTFNPLSISQILAWADSFHAKTGRWPRCREERIGRYVPLTWRQVDNALRIGLRGLPGGSSLPRLLEKERDADYFSTDLTYDDILDWADAHFRRTGSWPSEYSGAIHDAPEENWKNMGRVLRAGRRGLPGGTTLAWLLAEYRGVIERVPKPLLRFKQILQWADDHHERTGAWPKVNSGSIPGTDETWAIVNGALVVGMRGLPGGTSLARLLEKKRRVPNPKNQPKLTLNQILSWADDFHRRTGRWPRAGSEMAVPGMTWRKVDKSLRAAVRGLPKGWSLPLLLDKKRGVAYTKKGLTEKQILRWADGHYKRTGTWPKTYSGTIPGTSITWSIIDNALSGGLRGLGGDSSLPQFLAEHRAVRNIRRLPKLSVQTVLVWAEKHHQRTGKWPTVKSGPIPDSDGETWKRIDSALRIGLRGFPGGQSVARILGKKYRVRNIRSLSKLSVADILAWADKHRGRTGRWPVATGGGPVVDAPGETWGAISMALSKGHRSLPGGMSLAQLLARHRGVRNRGDLPRYSVGEILIWADTHFARHGVWPRANAGPIDEASGETWKRVDEALRTGLRGFKGGTSLARLLWNKRKVPHPRILKPVPHAQILRWADRHRKRTGAWPNTTTGPITERPSWTWKTIDTMLRSGTHGLPGNESLAQLLERKRGVRNRSRLPPLTIERILGWADRHVRRCGRWPTALSGPIIDAPGETWSGVGMALRFGRRGLPGGTSLPQLLKQYRGRRLHDRPNRRSRGSSEQSVRVQS